MSSGFTFSPTHPDPDSETLLYTNPDQYHRPAQKPFFIKRSIGNLRAVRERDFVRLARNRLSILVNQLNFNPVLLILIFPGRFGS